MQSRPEIPEPRKCVLWRSPERLEDIHKLLDPIETYLDDSHHMRRLMTCRECGQLYFYEFLEFIDFENGEDPQYRTYVPVTSTEDAALLSHLPRWDLLRCAPAIHSNWPKERDKAHIAWVGGPGAK
jgi:hypothetical protein